MDYGQRVRQYLEMCVYCDSLGGEGLYTQIARLELGIGPVSEDVILSALDFVNSRKDCSDFKVAGLLRILYNHGENPLLSTWLKRQIAQCLLNFKYWLDEPGKDSMCYWSENHQILFASAELIAGQLFPDSIFSNSGLNGTAHIEKATSRINKWLERRFYMGFSEWHSNVYYDEDMTALLNLADFAQAPEIALRSSIMLDIMLFELGINSFDGIFGVSHGRTYAPYVAGARSEATACVVKLLSTYGLYNSRDSMSGVSLAANHSYVPPPALLAIGFNRQEEFTSHEKMSINLEDKEQYGLSFNDFESGMFWWGMSAYADYRIVNLTFEMIDYYDLWDNSFFAPFSIARPLWKLGLLPYLSLMAYPVASGSVLSQVCTYSFKTPSYMLASAQDQCPGMFGYQQHIWQATIDQDAVIFTSHPGSMHGDTPGYWTGGFLPKVIQEQSALIAIYNWTPGGELFPRVVIPYTHAYFPRNAFDHIESVGKWHFANKGDALVALYSDKPAHWAQQGEWKDIDLIADGTSNIWICEMGRLSDYGTFSNFMQAIENASVNILGSHVVYDSPSAGEMNTGFYTPFFLNGKLVDLHSYCRFDNQHSHHEFGANPLVIRFRDKSLILDFEKPERKFD